MTTSFSIITAEKLEQAVRLYPKVVQKAYEQKIKTEKKQVEAVQRDEWRYDKVPHEVGQQEGMTLEQLEKLVQWKITHGASRPFLPAMIRKNDPAAVLEATSAAAKALSSLTADMGADKAVETVLSALAEASKLSGVGPATASLILAVYEPDLVPFFQDELWDWCCSGKTGTKLKYDKKEYELLFRQCLEIKHGIGKGGSMVDLEKASFVLQHLDLLTSEEKKALDKSQTQGKSIAGHSSKEPHQKSTDEKKAPAKTVTKRSAPPTKDGATQETETTEEPRRSKRAKK